MPRRIGGKDGGLLPFSLFLHGRSCFVLALFHSSDAAALSAKEGVRVVSRPGQKLCSVFFSISSAGVLFHGRLLVRISVLRKLRSVGCIHYPFKSKEM
ncbi:hypothetical protein TNCT_688201 [Trichonephila clavata]|uniref:Uncharacterized protein n=1 Tax=Trichonephila clavata TaxID=2740835 RepID=A0A8X6LZ50_TRICU|nr:hypothetical protein TNCT_688201 [Trichonephila clavata]